MNHPDCLSCGGPVHTLLDLGMQPPSNRFLAAPDEPFDRHPLVLGVCTACGLAQLLRPMPINMVRSRHAWLTYNEPEGHLDTLADVLAGLLPNKIQAHITGASYKDASLLQRLRNRGCKRADILSPLEMGFDETEVGIECIQDSITPAFAQTWTSLHPLADMLLVRHMLEHCHNPRAFLDACLGLIKDGGLLVFEVPDCSKIIQGGDHCFLWEEHTLYFTAQSLQNFIRAAGLELIDLYRYSYPMENSLVAIVRNLQAQADIVPVSEGSLEALARFASMYPDRTQELGRYFSSLKDSKHPAAIFGAGHLSQKFMNFYGIADYLSHLLDDDPHKQGSYLPGCQLVIEDSAVLDSANLAICLLTLNPESERQVLAAKKNYLEQGGRFLSIFSDSAISLYHEMEARL